MALENEPIVEEMDEAEDTTKNNYLIFMIDNEEYGVEVTYIKEIMQMIPITQVPQTPSYLKGIINLRGDIIPIIDVRDRFRKAPKEYDTMTCIVVIVYKEYILGMIVDSVLETLIIEEHDILPPPNVKLNYYNQFIRNIGRNEKRFKLLMDLERFLLDD